MPLPNLLNPQKLSQFKRYEILAQSVVEGFISGLHESPFKGFAIEFEEHRQYSPGDDLKHLDWKLVAKTNKYYIKQYEEDTSLRCYLVLDTSASMGYKSGEFSKMDFGRFICGVYTWLLLQQQDAVGLVLCDDDLRHYMAPRSTSKHLKNIFDRLLATEPSSTTGLAHSLNKLANLIKRRALIVIISDLFDDPEEIALALSHFSHKKHEVVIFQVLDRKEVEFDFKNLTRFDPLESGAPVMVDPLRLQREYQSQFDAHQSRIREVCHHLRLDFVQIMTDEPFEKKMAGYLDGRLRK
jgi:uncharacterized protein (DUF58 family)